MSRRPDFLGLVMAQRLFDRVPSCSLISCGEVVLVTADLTKIHLPVGPCFGEVVLVMADVTKELLVHWVNIFGGSCCSSWLNERERGERERIYDMFQPVWLIR